MHARKSWFRATVFCVTLALMGALITRPGFAGTVIKTGGTGSALRVIEALGVAFKNTHPDTGIVVLPGLGSSGAIQALGAQAIDLGLSARPLKPAERSQSLQDLEVGRTPMVFAGARPYPGLTLAVVADIYEGKRTWPDGRSLRLILRPIGDSETTRLRATYPALDRAVGSALARPGMHIALTDEEAATALHDIPGAFGHTTLAMLVVESRTISAYPLDGVVPSLNTLSSGRYRLFKPLYLVVRANAPEPVRALVAFIQSPQGARLLADHGYLPVAVSH